MRESTHTHFKFNRRTIAISLILTGLIPAWLYWNTVKYQNVWQVSGATRNTNLLTRRPASKDDSAAEQDS
ncbi:hypothetical protein HK105_208755 [Polyrhizophydium stewartii]|uniref:Uncharacterized protein n=1 Tax=Polyrhizophydium stewartii TaxID=2732419 RepID=A0ABR4MWX2_9FUNG